MFTDEAVSRMWSRFGHVATLEGARGLVHHLADQCGVPAPAGDLVDKKARGVAFAVRSAREYFLPRAESSLTLAALSYYYGSLWLMGALMIADPTDETTLADIEASTKQGHGLGSVRDTESGVQFPDDVHVYVKNGGFFRDYLARSGVQTGSLVVERRVDTVEALCGMPHWSLAELLARVPELQNAWDDTMGRPPEYVSVSASLGKPEAEWAWTLQVVPRSSSCHFGSTFDQWAVTGLEPTARTRSRGGEDLYVCKVPGPDAPCPLPVHTTAWCASAYVKPLADGLDKPLHYHFMALYLLSIMVRYQPNRWREIQEGGAQHLRLLATEYLMIAERIVPNLFLDHLMLRRHIFAGHSYVG